MEEKNESIFSNGFDDVQPLVRRRTLLPWWMKFFTWVFLIFGAISVLALLVAIFHGHILLELYGIKTNDPLSVPGLIVIAFFMLHGLTAYGLWNEKDWAIKLGTVDAIVGIVACIVMMFVGKSDHVPGMNILSFRFEIVLLIVFLVRLRRMSYPWEEAVKGS